MVLEMKTSCRRSRHLYEKNQAALALQSHPSLGLRLTCGIRFQLQPAALDLPAPLVGGGVGERGAAAALAFTHQPLYKGRSIEWR